MLQNYDGYNDGDDDYNNNDDDYDDYRSKVGSIIVMIMIDMMITLIIMIMSITELK